MKSKIKPALRTEEEERAFWEKEDSGDHVDSEQGAACCISEFEAEHDIHQHQAFERSLDAN